MFIYARNITERHLFVSGILEDRLGIPFKWINDESFLSIEKEVVVYSDSEMSDGLVMYDSGLLNESIIEASKISDGIDIFDAPDGFLTSFDLFSAVFFHLSRYEEYLCDDLDEHGRFKAKNSVLYQKDLLKRPVVDEWIYSFGALLVDRFNIVLNPPEYHFQPTFDIDVAYAYLGRPFWMSLALYAKHIKDRNYGDVKKRFRVNTGLERDPYDVFDTIKEQCVSLGIKPLFFLQVGDRGIYDKNLYPMHPLMRQLIEDISPWSKIGLHPSYHSGADMLILEKEKKTLEYLTGITMVKSRQHYLKLQFPNTIYALMKVGINEDYSLGYASEEGFRAGTCHAFPFFDLRNNKQTQFMLYPFVCMDGTLKNQKSYSIQEAQNVCEALNEHVKKNYGDMRFIWHNSSLSELGGWADWDKVLKHLFKIART